MNENTSVSPKVRIIPAKSTINNNSGGEDAPKLRVAGYARVSTLDAHQSTSYDLQVSYYEEYIQKNPSWTFYKVYADHGITGTNTKDRTQFMEMIQDAKDDKIDYIITKSISRFARNTLDCLHYIRLLKGLDKPVGVYFEKEKIDTLDDKSELFLTLLSSIAQEESRAISQNTSWSITRNFQRGNAFIPTTYFLGYDTDEDGNIVINEEQAEVVREIFNLFLEGKGTPTIASILMEKGRITARGNKTWTSDSVRKILKQEKYMGHCIAQKTVTVDFLTHKRVKNDGIKPRFFIKNCLPAIISEDDFNLVQQEFKRRNKMLDPDEKYNMRYSGKSLFSNKLFCGECGRPVTRRRLTSGSNIFTAWQCRVASQRDPDFKDCKSKYVWEEELEKAFMKILYEMKENKEKLISDAKQEIRICSLNEEEREKLEELERQIEAVNDRISDLASRKPSKNDSIYEATLRNLIYEQEILKMEYDRLDESQQESIYIENQLKELLEYLEEIEKPDDLFRDDIFIKTIEKGIVYNNHNVTFEFKCGIKRQKSAKKIRDYSKKK